MKEVTLFSKDSNDGIEREDVWILELVKDSECNSRWVVANETGSY